MRRLASHQLSMDTTSKLARGINPLEAALLAMVPLADLGLPTLILREGEYGYIGQLRHRAGERNAYLACIAPVPQESNLPFPWVTLVEGLVQTAGRRGAMTVLAEVPETEFAAIEILRRSGFLVYFRQTLYQRLPQRATFSGGLKRVRVRPALDVDWTRLQALNANLVPSLVQQISPFPGDTQGGLVIEAVQDGRLLGFLGIVEGKTGVIIQPLLHPDIYDEATLIFQQALALWAKSVERLPAYFCVRSYLEWLRRPLLSLGMAEGERQAVFVKHTVARLDHEAEVVRATREITLTTLAGTAEMILDSDTVYQDRRWNCRLV